MRGEKILRYFCLLGWIRNVLFRCSKFRFEVSDWNCRITRAFGCCSLRIEIEWHFWTYCTPNVYYVPHLFFVLSFFDEFYFILFFFIFFPVSIYSLFWKNWHSGKLARKPKTHSSLSRSLNSFFGKFLHQESFGDRASATGSFEEFIDSREPRLHREEWNPIRGMSWAQTIENNSRERSQFSVQNFHV